MTEEVETKEEGAKPEPSAETGTPGGEAEEVAGSGSEVGDELEELVSGLRAERDEYLDLARRAKADFENYRKRATQQAADAAKRGKAELARELLPAIDSLERALDAAESDSDALAKGVSLVRDQLIATLERAGVEAYDPAGERFDPTWHEALSTRPAEGVESGTVVETLDRGYRLDGQVLRPARVVVSE
ncbi:MAG TPA: nucleotide exchange factor GrpE [Solirubrobacterales bacterium]|nr:nucleotide exchange factor GrpE [Solirubrobacterales bacterium]